MSEGLFDRWSFRNGNTVGCTIQSILTSTSALQTMTTTIPHDDTIPTSSEGTALTNVLGSIMPKKIGNKIRVTLNLMYACSANVNVTASLFKNGGSAAISCATQATFAAGVAKLPLIYEETVTSLSLTSFTVRLGPASAGTISLNGLSGARLFGGTAFSSILIEEIQA